MRPSAFPPRYLAASARLQTADGRGGEGRGRSPGRCEPRSARPGWSESGAAARYARWAVCLEQTLGFPSSQHPWVQVPPRWGSQMGPLGHLGAPQHSDLPCLPQPYRAAELPRRWRGQCPRGGRPLARAARPPAPAEWLGPVADHPLASGRCPRARPPPAASARGQVHAGGAAVAASICSLHSHRPAPRRAPGRWSFGGLSY